MARQRLRFALALAATVLATLAGSILALSVFRQDRTLPVGTVRLSVHPGHPGSLALYVPLVDWGVRFDAVRFPAELRVDVRSVDRAAAVGIAESQRVDLHAVRAAATDAIAGYLRTLVAVVLLAGLLLGGIVALAVRSRDGPRVRWLLASAATTAAAFAVALVVLLPPRGELTSPEYFAHGGDIPEALQAVEAVGRSSGALSEALDAQLVGLARLVLAPGQREPTTAAGGRLTLASDIHNNLLVLRSLRTAARGGPLFIAGDLTDRGSPLETQVTQSVARAGDPVVFVSGNHDSDTLERALARAGAIVLSEDGQVLPSGRRGRVVVNVGGLRVAGYRDPYMRRRADRYAAPPLPAVTVEQQAAFDAWLREIEDRVDVVMVHERALAAQSLARLTVDPPSHPIAFLVGHTHQQELEQRDGVVVLNGGTAGGGGTGNLTEKQPIGLAVLSYDAKPDFEPLAADLVTIDPGTGAATARHEPLALGPGAGTADAGGAAARSPG